MLAVVKLDILFQKFPNPVGAVGAIGLWGVLGAWGMDGVFGKMGCATAGKTRAADMVAPPDDDCTFAADMVAFVTGLVPFEVTLDDGVFLTTTGVLFLTTTVVLFAQTITESQKTTHATAIKIDWF